MLPRLKTLCDLAIEWTAVVVTIAMVVSVMLGVLSRAVDDPLIWTDEVSRYLLVWLAGLGWVLAARRRAHIRISYFLGLLPAGVQRLFEIGIQALVSLLGALMIWKGVELVEKNSDLEATTVPLAMSWVYLPIVLIGAVTLVQALAEMIEHVRGAPLVLQPEEAAVE